jgi:hypothetical protein
MKALSRTIAGTAAATAALLALALPSAAHEAHAAQSASLVASFEHKGYAWTMIVTDGARDSLTLMATRKAGQATQTHTYSFSSGVNFKVGAGLASATLTANLGQFGRVNAAFRAGAALRSSSPPRGCSGPKSEARAGTLGGKPGLGFTIDSTFFKTISKPSVKASIFRQKGAGQLRCGTPTGGGTGQPAGQISLIAASQDRLTISVTKSKVGAVTQSVTSFETVAGASVFHSISSPAAASTFTVADDLSTARVTGAGPFLSGALDFTASAAAGKVSPGTLAGNFTARFDSIGAKSPAAGGELFGTLTRS